MRTFTRSSRIGCRVLVQRNFSQNALTIDTIISLCKRKGFIYPSSEIYNSLSGFYDYGPLGVEMKNNIKRLWWRDYVQRREDIVGIDCSIIGNSSMWEASGHVGGFSDPMVDCKTTKLRFRADHVWYAKVTTIDDAEIGYICVTESNTMIADANKLASKKLKASGIAGKLRSLDLRVITEITDPLIYAMIPSPITGEPGALTSPRAFNLMFQTQIGAATDGSSIGYLRPETAQGIFTNFANVQRTSRMKIPFGIAQIGKAFRNEISPRNFIFRSREFEQMEIEYFIAPEADWLQHHEAWVSSSWQWLLSIGLPESSLKRQVHSADDLAHYARACTDILFTFPFGSQELMGIAARGNHDLTQHARCSGKNLEYQDANTGKYLPHVIEPSVGVDRLVLALLTAAYKEEVVPATGTGTGSSGAAEARVVLALHPAIAPIKAAILPLVSNKPDIVAKARQLYGDLTMNYMCEWDAAGAIGRRYRRADEAGIPYCICVDYQTLDDDTVTLRHRDSMTQLRMNISDVDAFIHKHITKL